MPAKSMAICFKLFHKHDLSLRIRSLNLNFIVCVYACVCVSLRALYLPSVTGRGINIKDYFRDSPSFCLLISLIYTCNTLNGDIGFFSPHEAICIYLYLSYR